MKRFRVKGWRYTFLVANLGMLMLVFQPTLRSILRPPDVVDGLSFPGVITFVAMACGVIAFVSLIALQSSARWPKYFAALGIGGVCILKFVDVAVLIPVGVQRIQSGDLSALSISVALVALLIWPLWAVVAWWYLFFVRQSSRYDS